MITPPPPPSITTTTTTTITTKWELLWLWLHALKMLTRRCLHQAITVWVKVLVFPPEHPKRGQNVQSTPLSEILAYWTSAPRSFWLSHLSYRPFNSSVAAEHFQGIFTRKSLRMYSYSLPISWSCTTLLRVTSKRFSFCGVGGGGGEGRGWDWEGLKL